MFSYIFQGQTKQFVWDTIWFHLPLHQVGSDLIWEPVILLFSETSGGDESEQSQGWKSETARGGCQAPSLVINLN
jgi:hypothetical protein